MLDDYGYLNARIRGMKSNLLSEGFLQELQGRDGLPQIIDSLFSSPFAEDLSVALASSSGLEAVEKALRHNLSKTFNKVLKLSFGMSLAIVKVLLARWDVYNIKTVLRAKHAGRSKEEVLSALIPVGELDEPRLVELLKQPDIKAVLDTLATWLSPFAPPLARFLPEYLEKNNVSILEESLDRYYFQWALSQISDNNEDTNLAREIVRGQIDNTNISVCLKMVRNKLDVQAKSFIPGGHLSTDTLKTLADCWDFTDLLKELAKSDSQLEEILSSKDHQIADAELLLDSLLINKWANSFKKTHISTSIVLGFMGQKLREFLNLRMIARGKVHGAPVKDWLIQ